MPGDEPRHVVVVGGGFGGLEAARRLRRADVRITLVDKTNHHLFQPLIYQIATGALSEGDAAAAVRHELRTQANTEVLMAEVTDVDANARTVSLDTGEVLTYDSLILACGARTSYFGNDAWADVTYGLKTLDDALRLRERIYSAFEIAERTQDEDERTRQMTFVVIGGGPTGAELAGQLAIVGHHALKRDFRRIDPTQIKVILLDAGERVLAAFRPSLSEKGRTGLESLGVDVRNGARVSEIDGSSVTYSREGQTERIEAATIAWAAGVQAEGIAGVVARSTGAETDRAGRIKVQPDLSIPGHPEISVIGDVASVTIDGKPVPGLATAAIQGGRHVAKGIKRGAPGAQGPFRYFDKGALAVIGRGRAICEVRGAAFSGPPAMALYLGVHLFYLSGVLGRRLRVLNSWFFWSLGAQGQRTIVRTLPAPVPAPDPTEQEHVS